VTLVNRMVDARPCNVIDMLRRVRNRRTIIIIIIIIIVITSYFISHLLSWPTFTLISFAWVAIVV